ncbi:hypothetical protein BDR07DRAFT_1480799 [Suillus spraguei]|nr:hypothetical protein BDR07DRAFT_1480799 [Suillus spraguei]
MSIQESNYALSVANGLLHKAHEITQLVSQALQQHGRNASVISPLLLSAAAEVQEIMNNGQAPQWEHVQAGNSRMELHLFFPKTKGFVAPAVAKLLQPMLVLVIDTLLAEVIKTKTDKGKQPDWGTRQTREEDSDDESKTTTKKRKLAKHISKAVIMDTKDEDALLAGLTIFAKPPKALVPVTPAPSSSKASTSVKSLPMQLLTPSQDVMKEVKKKAVKVKEPELYEPPCTRCSDEHICVITYGARGLPVKACSRFFTLKVKCEWPADDPTLTEHVRVSCPRSKATPVSKSKPLSRMTRATSRSRPLMPVVESEDAMDDADVTVAAHEDVEMSHEANEKQPANITAVTPVKPMVNQLVAVASADDFPADHWQEDPDTVVIPPPSPPSFPSPPPNLTELTILQAESTHDWVVALAPRVATLEVANQDVAARVDVMHLDFDTCISGLQAEFSLMKADLDTMVILMDGVLNMVETLWQDRSAPNPLFLPPMADPNITSLATTLGRMYLNSVFNTSVAPTTNSVGITPIWSP